MKSNIVTKLNICVLQVRCFLSDFSWSVDMRLKHRKVVTDRDVSFWAITLMHPLYWVSPRKILYVSSLLCCAYVLLLFVIHQNGTSPSECRLSLCRRTKGHLWIEVCLEYYSLLIIEYISAFIQPVTLLFSLVRMYARLFVLTSRASIASLPCNKSRILVCAGCSSIWSRITRGLLYCIPAHVYLNILNFKTRVK